MKAKRWIQGWVIMALGILMSPCVWAHSFGITEMEVTLHEGGRFEIIVRPYSLDSIILEIREGAPKQEAYTTFIEYPEEKRAEIIEKVGEFFRTSAVVQIDGVPIDVDIEFPDQSLPAVEGNVPVILGERFVLTGQVPEGGTTFTLSPIEEAYEFVMLVIFKGETFSYEEFIASGETSTPFSLSASGGEGASTPVQPQSRFQVILQYIELGFTHIIPKGLDHILFVLGLFLLSAHLKPLLWQITAFTLAHTVTLALATMQIVQLPASIVEPLIALSIVYVAIENCTTDTLTKWRPAIVFGFGLLHGLGFAGVLQTLGLPEGRLASSLISFNIGVELGQLSVIALAFALLGWARNKDWYRKRITIPASITIALIAGYWTLDRVFWG